MWMKNSNDTSWDRTSDLPNVAQNLNHCATAAPSCRYRFPSYLDRRMVHETATCRCDDTRGCVMQFCPPDDEHICSKHVEARNKTYWPGRKQANISVRMAWISFGALSCRGKNLTARVSMLLKSRASLTCFRACFLPGRAEDLSARR